MTVDLEWCSIRELFQDAPGEVLLESLVCRFIVTELVALSRLAVCDRKQRNPRVTFLVMSLPILLSVTC